MKPLVTVALAFLLFSGVSGLSQPDSDYIKDHQRTKTFRHPTKPTDSQINGWKSMDWRTAIRYAGAAAVGAGTAIAGAPLVAGALGFTGAGIAAGSVASWAMSTAAVANGGGVAAGTVVAILQSVGAAGVSGAGAAVMGAVGAAVGAVAGGATGAAAGDVQSDC